MVRLCEASLPLLPHGFLRTTKAPRLLQALYKADVLANLEIRTSLFIIVGELRNNILGSFGKAAVLSVFFVCSAGIPFS
jgi:hypothetical protein